MSQSPTPQPYSRLSRRSLLRLSGAGLGTAWLLGHTAATAHADDFDLLASRWTSLTSGHDIDPSDETFTAGIRALSADAARQLSSYLDSGSQLWPDLPLGSVSANITASASRLKSIAMAIVTPGTDQYESASAADQVVAGIDHLCATGYTTDTAKYDNSWDWDIGTPQALTDAGIYLRSALTDTTGQHLIDSILHFPRDLSKSKGANLTDCAQIEIKLGVLAGDRDRIAAAVTAVPRSFDYVTDGDGTYASRDGMHADGSFIQHDRIAYTGTYGQIFLNGVATLAALCDGTEWAITDPRLENVFQTAIRGFLPLVWDGLMMDSVRGRALCRPREQDVNDGLATAVGLLTLARADSNAERRMIMRQAAKGMLTRSVSRPYTDQLSLPKLAIARAAMIDSSIPTVAEPAAHDQFPDMSRAVHRRSDWAFSIAMSSSRAAYYEALNGENIRGWHTGEGMGQLYLRNDNAQFNDNFWNTVDPQRIPGTTVQTKKLADGYGTGNVPTIEWVGGSVMNGRYGAVGTDLQGLGTSLTGRKSWFCLDDAVIALGSAITADPITGAGVETIIENRKLVRADADFVVDGSRRLGSADSAKTLPADWAHLEGVGGYLLLGGADIHCARVTRSGSYADIGGTDAAVAERTYLQIIRDHGSAPSAASYAYVLLPNASVSTTAKLSRWEPFRILENSPQAHAVADLRHGITMINFFTAGRVGGVTVDRPCSVITRRSRKQLEVAISDPTRADRTIEVSIAGRHYTTATADPEVTVRSSGRPIRLSADLTGVRGTSVRAVLSD